MVSAQKNPQRHGSELHQSVAKRTVRACHLQREDGKQGSATGGKDESKLPGGS